MRLVNNWPLYQINQHGVSARRIPSFVGAVDACEQFSALPEFQAAKTVKVHPSLGATRLRQLVLESGKDLLVPPLPEHDFLYYLLSPSQIPPELFKKVSERSGWVNYGRPLQLEEIPKIDLVVVATVAVAPSGARLGKGMGYGEIEFGICTEIGAVDNTNESGQRTAVATIVHDGQVVADAALGSETLERHDLPIDIICTPSRVIHTRTHIPRPPGILWGIVTEQMYRDIGALKSLRRSVA